MSASGATSRRRPRSAWLLCATSILALAGAVCVSAWVFGGTGWWLGSAVFTLVCAGAALGAAYREVLSGRRSHAVDRARTARAESFQREVAAAVHNGRLVEANDSVLTATAERDHFQLASQRAERRADALARRLAEALERGEETEDRLSLYRAFASMSVGANDDDAPVPDFSVLAAWADRTEA